MKTEPKSPYPMIAQQERERFLAGWSTLRTSMRRRSIVNGIVSSVEIRHVGGPDEVSEDQVLLAVMLDGGYKVLVPFEEFYQESPVDMRTASDLDTAEGQRELTRRKRALAEKLYKLQIPLIITDMEMNDRDENGAYDYAIVGSRRKALDIIEMQNFGSPRGGNQVIKEGDMVPATVTSVSIHSVDVVVGGVDTRIPMRHLLPLSTISCVYDARTAYSVGQELLVRVNRIETLPNGRHSIEVSENHAELVSARMNQKLIPLGTSTLGVITSVRPAPARPDVDWGDDTTPKEPLRAAIYRRVATREQAEDNSQASQREFLTRDIRDGRFGPNCYILNPQEDPAAVKALRAYAAATENAELGMSLLAAIEPLEKPEHCPFDKSTEALQHLFDEAWTLNTSDKTRTPFTQLAAGQLSGIMQDFTFLVENWKLMTGFTEFPKDKEENET